MTRCGTISASAALVLSLLACDPGEESPLARHQIVTWESIHPLPASAGFTAIREVSVFGGSVWVLDAAPPYLARIPLNRGPEIRFGKKGEGPGEFNRPWSVQPVWTEEGTGVAVWDMGAARVTLMDPSGGVTRILPIDSRGMIRARMDIAEVSYADPFRLRTDGSEVVLARFPGRVDRTGDMGRGVVARTGLPLEPGGEIFAFPDPGQLPNTAGQEWSSVPLWDACQSSVVVWSPTGSRLIWLNRDGETMGTADVEIPPTPVRVEDIEAYLSHMGRLELGPDFDAAGIDFAAMASANRSLFADLAPAATDLRCESPGVAWIRLFGTSEDPLGHGRDWLRVPMAGSTRRITFPEGFAPLLFGRGGALGIQTTPEGEQSLATWRRPRFANPGRPRPFPALRRGEATWADQESSSDSSF